MRIRKPKNMFLWIFITVAAFCIGLLIAILLQPTTPVLEIGKSQNILHPQAEPPVVVSRTRGVSYTAIAIFLSITLALLGYGVYKEKQKKVARY